MRIPAADLPDEVAALLGSRGAAQVGLYQALANSPEMVRAWTSFIWALRDEATTPRAIRELVILRTAIRHASSYEWHHHVAMAMRAGVTETQVGHVASYPTAGCFTAAERTALELTDAICDSAVPAALAERAIAQFGPRVYTELCLTAAAYSMVPRVLDSLGVLLEEGVAIHPAPFEQDPGSGSPD